MDPARLPAHLRMVLGTRRQSGVISQESLALAAGVSTSWYTRLETGRAAGRVSDEVLESLARVLGLGPLDRATLWRWAARREPPETAYARAAGTDAAADLIAMVPHTPWPAYVSDEAWDLISYNQHMLEWFPQIEAAGFNVMIWTFCEPAAQEQLVDWELTWARPMIAGLRAQVAATPEHTRLQAVVRQVLAASSHARQLWDEQLPQEGHPHGAIREVRPAHLGGKVIRYRVTAMSLTGTSQPRLITLMPTDPAVPEGADTAATWR